MQNAAKACQGCCLYFQAYVKAMKQSSKLSHFEFGCQLAQLTCSSCLEFRSSSIFEDRNRIDHSRVGAGSWPYYLVSSLRCTLKHPPSKQQGLTSLSGADTWHQFSLYRLHPLSTISSTRIPRKPFFWGKHMLSLITGSASMTKTWPPQGTPPFLSTTAIFLFPTLG